MNCIIVVPSLRRAGAESQAVDLANGLAACGHKVHVFTFAAEDDQKDRLRSDVQLHYCPRNSKYSIAYLAALARILDENEVDIIYGVMQFATLVGWISSLWSKRRPPIVASIHTTTNYDFVSEVADRFVFRPVLGRVPVIVFVCNFQRDYWIKKYPTLSGRSIVIYNGIDTRQFKSDDFLRAGQSLRQKCGINDSHFVFSCIAGFRPEKAHEILIKAFSQLPVEAVLLLAGDGQTKASIEAIVNGLGIGGRVKFLGNMADVRPVLAASDASILSSTAVETFSIAMLESMAMSTPMIAPQIGGLAEAIIDGETGMLFPVGDCDAMSGRMQMMMLDRDAARRMGVKAQSKIEQEFTLDHMIRASETVLLNVVSQNAVVSK